MYERNAYGNGFASGFTGGLRSGNPYLSGTSDADAWDAGWWHGYGKNFAPDDDRPLITCKAYRAEDPYAPSPTPRKE